MTQAEYDSVLRVYGGLTAAPVPGVPPIITEPIHIDELRPFAGNGQLYRAFGCALAAGDGVLVAVPIALMAGNLQVLIDGCPVNWAEVCAVLDVDADTPADSIPWSCRRQFGPDHPYSKNLMRMAALGDAWRLRLLTFAPGGGRCWVFSQGGMRFAITADLVYAGAAHVE